MDGSGIGGGGARATSGPSLGPEFDWIGGVVELARSVSRFERTFGIRLPLRVEAEIVAAWFREALRVSWAVSAVTRQGDPPASLVME